LGVLTRNFGTILGQLGLAIISLFAASWLASALFYRAKHYDDI
jgi:high-affinity nickel permease